MTRVNVKVEPSATGAHMAAPVQSPIPPPSTTTPAPAGTTTITASGTTTLVQGNVNTAATVNVNPSTAVTAQTQPQAQVQVHSSIVTQAHPPLQQQPQAPPPAIPISVVKQEQQTVSVPMPVPVNVSNSNTTTTNPAVAHPSAAIPAPTIHHINNRVNSTTPVTSAMSPPLTVNAPPVTVPPSHTNAANVAAARAAALGTPRHSNLTTPSTTAAVATSSIPNTTKTSQTSKKRSKKANSISMSANASSTSNNNSSTNTNNSSTTSNNSSSNNTSGGENTGRWTAEEHRLFLQGLEQHGKGWKKIASLIKSRTVVQIRTHAQKYFQKLAKARQNGEEGDVSMEGRGGVAHAGGVGVVGSGMVGAGGVGANAAGGLSAGIGGGVGTGAHGHAMGGLNGPKRRRVASGTKRKAITSVVSSAMREGKRMKAEKSSKSLPAVAPALSPFVFPPPPQKEIVSTTVTPAPGTNVHDASLPSITTAHGTISGAALEDSLFRFLTPAPGNMSQPVTSQTNPPTGQVNDIARQAGANPIVLPNTTSSNVDNSSKTVDQQLGGDVSPTGVADFNPNMSSYPNWVWSGDSTSWYNKGADVDELLSEADALNWLADSGDLDETYQPPPQLNATEEPVVVPTDTTVPDESVAAVSSEPSLLSLSGVLESSNNLVGQDVPKPSTIVTVPSSAFNVPTPDLPPSIPNLFNKNSQKSTIPDVSTSTSPKPHVEPVSSSSMNVMPPLPSLFESSNSINALNLNDTKKKMSGTHLSSVSLFGAGNETDFFAEETLEMEEEDFVNAMLD